MTSETKEHIAAINSGIIPEGYKKTKVGIVPVEWDIENLKELCEISSGNTPSRNRNNNFVGDNKWLSSGELKSKYIYDSNEKISDEAASELKTYQTGTVVIAIYGLEAEGVRGSCSILAVPCTISQACMAFEKFSKLHNEFFYYWYQFNGNTIGLRYAQGTKQQNLSSDIVEKLNVSVPPLTEQQKIAEILSTQDKLIELQEKKIEQLKELKKAYLQKMFPKKGSKYPELRFKGFTGAWEQRKLIEIVKSIDTGKSKFQSDSDNGKFAILGSTSIIGYDDSYDYDGDFILTARVGANAGSLYRYTGKAKISDNTVFIQTEKNIEFVYYMLTKFDIKQLSFGTGQPLVKASELKNLDLKMPSQIEEQQKIGSFFSQLDTLITLHQRKSEQEKQKKKALMQLLLTGIVRTK